MDLLEEIVSACPDPVVDLMEQLVENLNPELTQTRYFEIGPVKWWLTNLMKCPTIAHMMLGSRLSTHYVLRSISARVTNLPIFSKSTNRRGLKFVEIRLNLSMLTPQLMMSEPAYIHCRYRARDFWNGADGNEDVRGVLVRTKLSM